MGQACQCTVIRGLALRYTQICSIIMDHPAHATLFPTVHCYLCAYFRAVIKFRNSGSFFIYKKAKRRKSSMFLNHSMWVRWSAALYGHQASIEEYFSIVILCQGCSFNLDEFYSVCCTEGQQIKLLCYLEQSEFPTPFLFQASLRSHDSRSKKKKKTKTRNSYGLLL